MNLSNIIIFDIKNSFIQEAKRLEKYGIKVLNSDVKELINSFSIGAIVSPANSFGFMDGGIDKIYSEIFPNIQHKVQNKIKSFGLLTNGGGQYYLPIGSSITIPTMNTKCPYLISAPTMFFPGNIKNTENVFFAFLSIIYIAKMNPSTIIACPGLGTGVGMLDDKYAVDQIELAIINYDKFISSNEYLELVKYKDKMNIVIKKIPCIQPNNSANREILF